MTVNVAGYVLAAGSASGAGQRLSRALTTGAEPEAVSAVLSLAWRVAFLRALAESDAVAAGKGGLDAAVARLERAAAAIEGDALERRLGDVSAASRTAHALAVAGGLQATGASRRLVGGLAAVVAVEAGQLASAVIGSASRPGRPARLR